MSRTIEIDDMSDKLDIVGYGKERGSWRKEEGDGRSPNRPLKQQGKVNAEADKREGRKNTHHRSKERKKGGREGKNFLDWKARRGMNNDEPARDL